MKRSGIISFIILALLVSLQPAQADETLDKIKNAIDNNTKWEFRVESDLKKEELAQVPWKPAALTHYKTEKQVRYRSSIVIPEVFAGTKITGGKAILNIGIAGPADYRITAWINGKEVFKGPEVDPVTRIQKISPLLLAEKAVPGTKYQVEILIENPLIYPAQAFPLSSKTVGFGPATLELEAAAEMFSFLSTFKVNLDAGLAMTIPYDPVGNDKKPFFPERTSRSTLKPEKLKELNSLFKEAVAGFDLAALEAGESDKVKTSAAKVLAELEPLSKHIKQFTVYLVGNAHIDLAWLWRTNESIEIAANTYKSVMNNIDIHPELIYAQSQAQTYKWVEDHRPELFKRIQKEVKEGRWDIVGGMWAEPDCNLIGGESWIRQILYANLYFKEKFDKEVSLGWNPDSFGYNYNMPQFYSKSGIKAFITQKISWNMNTRFPYHIFWWEAPDGSRILTYLPTGSYVEKVEHDKIIQQLRNFEDATGYKEMLSLIGFGNHGGGPNLPMIERAILYNKQPLFPNVEFIKAHDYIAKIMEKDLSDIPVWKSEMYLENHRGTFTTQASTKAFNRRNESLMEAAEKAASIANMLGMEYPAASFEKAWKTILLNQFHDILPGSSITPVFRDSDETSAVSQKIIKRTMHASLQFIAEKLGVKSEGFQQVLVYNPLSWKRSGRVNLLLKEYDPAAVNVTDAQGKEIPSRIVTSADGLDRTLEFYASDLPALGFKFFNLHQAEEKSLANADAGKFLLENKFLKVTINPETGNLSSIFDKVNNREVLAAGTEGNVIELHENLPGYWDAWNIGYTGEKWSLNKADSIELLENNSFRTVIRVKKSFLGKSKSNWAPTEGFPSSFFIQDIILYRGSKKLDVELDVDWWEDHTLAKVAFPLSLDADVATYEIPYASIERSTRRNSEFEKARYEVPVHRWADVSLDGYGVSLLNESKYGMDIHNNVMRLTLLTSPIWPDPMADRGRHKIAYSIYPHKGDWRQAETVKHAAEVNIPLVAHAVRSGKGAMPKSELAEVVFAGLARVNVDNALITTIKKAELDSSYILRIVETHGKSADVEVSLPKEIKTAAEVTMLEKDLGEATFAGKKLTFKLGKYEVKSFKVTFK